MRPIDADALWKDFISADKDDIFGLEDVEEILDNAPTIESCEDTISIEVAIQTTWMILNGMGYPKDQNEELDQTIKAVFDTAPRVAPSRTSGEWIPCSERLPEYRKTVLISTFWGVKTGFLDSTEAYGDFWEIIEDDATVSLYNVYAWMPLPEPWKGADDE